MLNLRFIEKECRGDFEFLGGEHGQDVEEWGGHQGGFVLFSSSKLNAIDLSNRIREVGDGFCDAGRDHGESDVAL